jgi:hypothetical protein
MQGGGASTPNGADCQDPEVVKALRKEFDQTVRPQFWEQEAIQNPGEYSAQNVSRMLKGNAPYGIDGYPMELHHITPLVLGGTNDPSNLKKMTRTEHRLGDNYRLNHPGIEDC